MEFKSFEEYAICAKHALRITFTIHTDTDTMKYIIKRMFETCETKEQRDALKDKLQEGFAEYLSEIEEGCE